MRGPGVDSVTEFKIPELGENVAGGDVTRVMINVGDTVTKDQAVIELETDKATIEVPSSVAGVVKEIKIKKGEKVKVGAVVFTVDEGAAGTNGAKAASGAATEAKSPEPEKKPEPEKRPPSRRRRP